MGRGAGTNTCGCEQVHRTRNVLITGAKSPIFIVSHAKYFGNLGLINVKA